MLLSPQDAALFFKLHKTLMFFVNQQLNVLPGEIATLEKFSGQPPDARIKVGEAFLKNTGLLQKFILENPAHFSDDELQIVSSWQNLVAGNFYICRHTAKYMVFFSSAEHAAYGVLGLTQPFDELIGPQLPVLAKTVLLPFKGQIIYDGLLNLYSMVFGSGIRRSINEGLKQAKEKHGIVLSLPMSNQPLPAKPSKPRASQKSKSKEVLSGKQSGVAGLVDQFCRENLNEEYAAVCLALTEKLARKRPSPLLSGSAAAWACGIVRTIGWVNFLDDPAQKPHMKLTAVDSAFGVSQGTGQGKSKKIRDMFKIRSFDVKWTLPSRLNENPMVWMIQVNGMLFDARHAPREIQEEAFARGLIPFIPGEMGFDSRVTGKQ